MRAAMCGHDNRTAICLDLVKDYPFLIRLARRTFPILYTAQMAMTTVIDVMNA
jgi:hypothetical protein